MRYRYMSDEELRPNARTRQVKVGDVCVGGGAPVSVQSMCMTPTSDAAATLAQIEDLAQAGCEIIRVAVPNEAALDGFEAICAASPLPVVADIHFDWRLAVESIKRGALMRAVVKGFILINMKFYSERNKGI